LLAAGRLLWLPELQLGFLAEPPTPGLYDASYWETYRERDKGPVADELNFERIMLVRRHFQGMDLVDVGIGGGRFVNEMACLGWDVNPYAVEWLRQSGALRDPRSQPVEAVTMWDSIEHMVDPGEILRNVRSWAFISTPIYKGPGDAINSKHFKPGEHLWYFTVGGLCEFMRVHGFALFESNEMECKWRESIGSFAFRRSEPW